MMRAALWVFAGKLGNQVIALVVVMILARLLTPEDFGIIAASQVILALSQVVVRFGIGAYLIQAETLTPRIIRTAQTLMLSAALCLSVALWFSAGLIGDAINVPELTQIMPIMMASFILSAAINPSASLLSRDMDFKFLAKTEISSQAIGYGAVAVVLAALGFGFWAIIVGTFMQTLMRAVFVLWRVPVWPSLSMKLSEITPMLRFGGGVFMAQLMSNSARRIDNLIIISTMGPATLGYYSRAYGLMEISNTLLGSVFREVLFSGFSKKRREREKAEQASAFYKGHAFAAFLILPISVMTWLLADEVVWIVLGANWVDVVPVLEVLSLSMFFRLGYKVSGAFILSEGKVLSLTLRNLLFALMVASGAWIGSHWGVAGVAWGVFFALVIHFVSMTTTALMLCRSNWAAYIKTLLPLLLAAILAGGIAYGARSGLSTTPALDAVVGMGVFMGVYTVLLFIARQQPAVQSVLVQLEKFLSIAVVKRPK
jgi:PST family polysaccharide transporter